MAKKVIGYYEGLIGWHDGLGRLRQRTGYFPIYKDIGTKDMTTLESELPSIMSLEAYANIWQQVNTGKERR